jgi:hypothetical protein
MLQTHARNVEAKLSFKLVQISSKFIDVALTIITFAFITFATVSQCFCLYFSDN